MLILTAEHKTNQSIIIIAINKRVPSQDPNKREVRVMVTMKRKEKEVQGFGTAIFPSYCSHSVTVTL